MEKSFRLYLSIFCMLLSGQIIYGQRQYLHDGWTFGQARSLNRYPAKVPGVVHTDLLANKLIEDPYFRLNERSVQWVDKEDWIYENSFEVNDSLIGKDNISLFFNGLDTYADVYLNDREILNADNMFRRWEVDVKPYLKPGTNHLKIYLHSPLKIDMAKWDRLPYQYSASNDQSENGGIFDRKLSVFARKAGYHYGWDWGPRLVTSGIWRDVYLDGWDVMRIDDAHFRQHEVSSKNARLTDVIQVTSDEPINGATVRIKDKDTGRTLASKKCDIGKGVNEISLDFNIKNPRLWWCNGLGKPELYTFLAEIGKDGEVIASKTVRTGIRSVKVVTDNDLNGNMQFYFVLNGVPVFAKGTNYIPQDNFLTEVTADRYVTTIDDAKNANMNMVRVWGGGIYENDLFYDLCDEAGLMVWQDFMFACSVYPATGAWLESVRNEAIDNVCRLRNHPCIALWCGGNECLDAWYNWGWKNKMLSSAPQYADIIEEELNRQYFGTLPEVMAQYAPESFYWPSSPFTAKGQGSDGINGDRHYWTVWHRKAPIDSYNRDMAHFFSEYGMQSFPEYNSVLKFAPDTADHTIDGEVMMSHQRGGDHANKLIEWYLESEYRHPQDFGDFLYATHVMQADAMRTAIEAHRRNMPYCMGSLLWQHNDCWPVASWSTRDYYGKWKAAHYLVKKAFENVIASADITGDSIKIYAISDLLTDKTGTLTINVITMDGKKVYCESSKITVPANMSTKVWESPVQSIIKNYDNKSIVINVGIECDGYTHNGNYYLCKQKELQLSPSDIKMEINPATDGYILNLKSDKFVRAVWLSVNDDGAKFNDNCFDLLPGTTRSCAIKTDLSPTEIQSRLKIQCLNNI